MPLAWIMFCGNSVSWLVDYKVWSEKNVKKKKQENQIPKHLLRPFTKIFIKFLSMPQHKYSQSMLRKCNSSIVNYIENANFNLKHWGVLGFFCFGSFLKVTFLKWQYHAQNTRGTCQAAHHCAELLLVTK